jgi:hypothetical protein
LLLFLVSFSWNHHYFAGISHKVLLFLCFVPCFDLAFELPDCFFLFFLLFSFVGRHFMLNFQLTC